MVCWLLPKRAMFDLQLCFSGPGVFMSLPRGRGRQSLPKGVGKSLPALSSWWSECTQVVLGDPPRRGSQWQTSFNREVTQSSAPMEPGARWHITASPCAAISRMRHRGVCKFASEHREGGLLLISPNAWANVVRVHCAPPPPPTASFFFFFPFLGRMFSCVDIFFCLYA